MTQDKVKILVACHKPDKVYSNDIYVPIHVGRTISKYKSEMNYMIGDDTGYNISYKNPYYSELTAQYWAWKNLNVEYIGLCHYRRYFASEITFLNIDNKFKNIDVILINPIIEKINIGLRLQYTTSLEDFIIFYRCFKKIHPEYINTLHNVLNGNSFSPYNMFIMKKKEFDKFADWQFSILFEMEKHVRLSGYSRARRLYGYFSEVLLTIYSIHNNLKIKYDFMVPMIGIKPNKIPFKYIREKIRTLRFKILKLETIYDDPAVSIGLKNDLIEI